MLRSQLRVLSGACIIAAACGGQAFTAAPLDGGPGNADAAGFADSGSDDFDAMTRADSSARDAGSADAPADAPVTVVACTGAYACIAAIPTGWSGPVALYAGANARPPCGTGFQSAPVDQNDVLSAPAATCNCACGTPQGGQCSASVITFSSGATSGLGVCAAPCSSAMLAPGKCTSIGIPGACTGMTGLAMSATASAPQGGSCAATPSTTLPPTQWSTNARACNASAAMQAADCDAGSLCAPLPQAPFGATACIAKTGDVLCPATDYTVRHVYFGGIDDGRACSACTCGSVVGVCTNTNNVDINVYATANGTCGGGVISYQLPASCETVEAPADFLLNVAWANGSCSASAVTATGTATPAQPTTYCCLP